jgi:hypothetical protein
MGLGAELVQRPQAARGALLPFECLRKARGVQAFRGWRHVAALEARPGREGQGEQSRCLLQPTGLGSKIVLKLTWVRSQVSGVVETWVWAADNAQPAVALFAKKMIG